MSCVWVPVGKHTWSIFHDDEAMRNVTPDRKTTLVTGVCPILGKILICTTDKHGNSVGLPVSPAELKALIKFTGAYSREALQHVKRVKQDDSE
jgi:hypothetical protein